MNFYGIRKTNSASECRADSKTNKLVAKRISNYELGRANQNISSSGIDRRFDLYISSVNMLILPMFVLAMAHTRLQM